MADRVVFLRPDAERIARVVRQVEAGNRDEKPLRFGRIIEPTKSVRIASFSGVWNKMSSKAVTLLNSSNTVVALNVFANVPAPGDGTAHCAIAKDKGAWYLIAAECD